MNPVIETLMNHCSIRNYQDKSLSNEIVETIVSASQAAPSSINGQHVSIIVVTDHQRKEKLAELCGNQPWINEAPAFFIFCSDFYRAKLAADKNRVDFKVINSLEATIIGSVDIGLTMQNAIICAESLKCGVVPIGGIRNNPSEVARLLELPEYVFPICGLCVGYPNQTTMLKPRLPLQSVLNRETYQKNQLAYIDKYDEEISNYMVQRTSGESKRNWSQTISNYYKNTSTRDMRKEMEKQGFRNE